MMPIHVHHCTDPIVMMVTLLHGLILSQRNAIQIDLKYDLIICFKYSQPAAAHQHTVASFI